MQYLGGKNRQAPGIVRRIVELSKFRHVVEPFCGGCNVTAAFTRRGLTVEASDLHAPLIAMWNAVVQRGWLPQGQDLLRETWELAKDLPDTDPMKAFIGFACSFGGRYFTSPALGLNSSSSLTYMQTGRRALETKLRSFHKLATFQHQSFFDIKPRSGVILYCDPPYDNTTGYNGTRQFDSAAFWDRCCDWYNVGADVFVSEYSAPSDIKAVLERRRRVHVNAGIDKVGGERIERLYSLDPDATLKNVPKHPAWIERDL
jgi:DNA adenine methylase